jgi:hypothetical protein
LLKNSEQGLRITGLVLLVEEPRRVQGKSAKGNPYDFWMLGLQIWTGNKAVQCGFRADSLDALPTIEAGAANSFKIESGRVRDGQLVFDHVNPKSI